MVTKYLSAKPRKNRTQRNFQAEYFAKQFTTYDEVIQAYRGGGHIPSRQDFDRANLIIKKVAV